MEQQSKFFSQQADMDAKGIQAQLEGRLAQIVDPSPPDMMTAIVKGGANAASAGASMKETSWGDIVGA